MDGCLSEDEVSEFVSGRLAPERQLTVERHLDSCRVCLSIVARTASMLLRRSHASSDAAVDDTWEASPAPVGVTAFTLEPGQSAGRYRVVQVLGAGAMGTVYLAEDPALERRVAIKVLRSDDGSASSRAMRRRLLGEAHAMARLQHANVVTVYDVGLLGDSVFIVMEYVDGVTLREWCRARPRAPSEVLDTFLQAGRGLLAAHDAGLVHRDFKPENVLISGARVLVSDFGLAKPIADDAAGEIAGTPSYMAPEQLAGRDAGTRSDIFSFAVALWEAIEGHRPFVGDTLRALRNNVEAGRIKPPRTLPVWLRQLLSRALATDPEARPASMAVLLRSLERGRNRRRRQLSVAAALVAAAVVGVGAWAAQRRLACSGASRQLAGVWDEPRHQAIHDAFVATGARLAEERYASVAKVLDERARSWVLSHESACEASAVHHQQSAELLDLRMSCLTERLNEMRALSDQLLHADAALVSQAVAGVGGLSPIEDCSDIMTLSAPVRPPHDVAARKRVDAVRSKVAEANALRLAGRYDAAAKVSAEAVSDASSSQYAPVEAEAFLAQGLIESDRGHFEDAEHQLQRAAEAADRGRHDLIRLRAARELVQVVGVRETKFSDGHLWARTASTVLARLGANPDEEAALAMNVGNLEQSEGKLDDAARDLRHALQIRDGRAQKDQRDIGVNLLNLGTVLDQQGKFEEALQLYRRAQQALEQSLGPRHPNVATAIYDAAGALLSLNRNQEALAEYQKALSIREAALGPDHPSLAMTFMSIANAYGALGDHQKAVEMFERAMPIARKSGPVYESTVGFNMALDVAALGEGARAVELARKAVELRRAALGPKHASVGEALLNLGSMLYKEAHYEEAEQTLSQAREVIVAAFGPEHEMLAGVEDYLGLIRLKQHRPADALRAFEHALKLKSASLGENNSGVSGSLYGIGEAHLMDGKPALALPVLEKALKLQSGSDVDPLDRATTQFALARALARLGKPREAAELAKAALTVFDGAGAARRSDAADVRAWLARR